MLQRQTQCIPLSVRVKCWKTVDYCLLHTPTRNESTVWDAILSVWGNVCISEQCHSICDTIIGQAGCEHIYEGSSIATTCTHSTNTDRTEWYKKLGTEYISSVETSRTQKKSNVCQEQSVVCIIFIAQQQWPLLNKSFPVITTYLEVKHHNCIVIT